MRARIGPYRIVGTLRHGGMGLVYEGFHDDRQRRVTIKALNIAQGADPDELRRLRAEAQAQARLRHPNVVVVYDLIEDLDQGEAFIAMEYVEGTTLDLLLAKRQGLPLAEALPLGVQLLTALEYVHQQGVIHRDVKPSNVILSEGRLKLTDFGIALLAGIPRQTAASVILGTPTYMSPEQLQGLKVDRRTDIYSAAVVLYEMLAGRPPFTDDSHYELMRRHLREEPEDLAVLVPALPAGVCQVIAIGLRKEPRERYQTAGELLRALQEGAAGFLPAMPAPPQVSMASRQRLDPTVLLPPPTRPSPATDLVDRARQKRRTRFQLADTSVCLGAATPRQVEPGAEFVVRFAAYTGEYRSHVTALLKQESPRSKLLLALHECEWRIGTVVTTCLSCRHLSVSNPVQSFTWDGKWRVIRFDVSAPVDCPIGPIVLRLDVCVEGVPIVTLRPEIDVASGRRPTEDWAVVEGRLPRTAFASYAKQDRHLVLGRVRSLQICTGINVFVDCLSIRPGQQWKPAIYEEICRRDVFWLFWSSNARASSWVNWEWRTALEEKSLAGIQPHPLESSDIAPPPPELERLQFGTAFEVLLSAQRSTWLSRTANRCITWFATLPLK